MSAENSVNVLLATTQVAHMVIGKPFNDAQLLAVFGRVQRLVFGPFTAHSRYQISLIRICRLRKITISQSWRC
ncbi:MAG: hypothetical protein U5L01_04390 [Rheinheimera sp.]|nr:hypothetical protein [Rheinheimera sp.]